MGLSENNLLIGLSENIIQHVHNLCEFKTYNQNELVAAREEENRSIFFIISGTYSVETTIDKDQDLRYADMSANDFFGEISALDGLPRSADVRCRTTGEVAELQHEDFESILLTEPQITLRLLKIFTTRLRQTNQRLQDFSTTSPSARVIQQIIRLVRPSPDNPGQWLISPTPRHDEIASWTGTSRSFVSSILGQLMHDGLIIRRNRDMLVLDLFSLKNLGEK
ncbi:MAG: Crp/Fnr family transcriptional regulator [Alphaproteobacteria bacterium]